ncbi:hypothetical protein ACKI1H_25675 [Pseudomonas sp. YH-1]|uniref:hypothetical protein n=1 Tax=Pseudomonas sp. YH-1 TaxID=3384787 RepID=UPI003F808CC2
MILLIRGKTQKFNCSGFTAFLRDYCGFSTPLSKLAAAKVLSGERVALKLHDLSSREDLDKLGVSYCFSDDVEKRAAARPL